jgi:quercetin dioxygenase-like cupin family protein
MKIIKTNELPEVGVSHNPEIKKKVFIEKSEIPQLMTFGQAVLRSGQEVDEHVHPTMCEVFYILSGKAVFQINGTDYQIVEKDCIYIESGERHSQKNPFEEDATWLYFGISTEA